ncbi:MAG: nucleoid occlusion factor SlmA [Gammaproteobacteria bacterium]|nr:nucleoid occlusion factor SlmA [Gammaproteobacteria bacterium]
MRSGRKQQILEVLARELEARPGTRITTAALAAAVGVSEAALYRHFPSKAKMFEALFTFAEDAVFGLFTRILEEQTNPVTRCQQMLLVVLQFVERNPGLARLLTGDILVDEQPRLRVRSQQFFERIETQLKQVLRDATLVAGPQPDRARISAAANLLTAVASGRISQFVHSGFRANPSVNWDDQWAMLAAALFHANEGAA